LKNDLDKISSNTDIVDHINPLLQFHPNPMTNSAILRLDNTVSNAQKLIIYNAMGQKVMSEDHILSHEIIIEKNNMENGIYYFHLLYDSQKVAVGKLIVQ
jgi:hypothetical protein